MATGPVANFSGGEKARLALALIVWQRPNLLLLDEPTNHLDLETREALTVALAQFEGTLVLVSHDRHLLRATTDQLLIVADGTLRQFDGDLDDYRDWLLKRRLRPPKKEREKKPVAAKPSPQPQRGAPQAPRGTDGAAQRAARPRSSSGWATRPSTRTPAVAQGAAARPGVRREGDRADRDRVAGMNAGE